MLGAIRVNDFLGHANGSGQANGDHASSRTDPDGAECPDRYLRICEWGLESLRARFVRALVVLQLRSQASRLASHAMSSSSSLSRGPRWPPGTMTSCEPEIWRASH
jgi:hypothetical protein